MEIELKGMPALIEKMEALRLDLAGPEMKKALRAGGRVIRDAMEARAPELTEKTPGSDSLNPGELKASMRVYIPVNETPLQAVIGPSKKTEHVARFVEYGHRMIVGGQSKLLADGKTRGPGRSVGKDVPPWAFLRPAFESSIGEAEAAMEKSLSESIQERTR